MPFNGCRAQREGKLCVPVWFVYQGRRILRPGFGRLLEFGAYARNIAQHGQISGRESHCHFCHQVVVGEARGSDPNERVFIRKQPGFLLDLALRCIIGIYPEERREKQDVVINVEMHCDLRKAGRSDDLNDTVDYKAVKKATLKLVEGSTFRLTESMAEHIASFGLDHGKS